MDDKDVQDWMKNKRDGRKVERLAKELGETSIDGTRHHKDGTMSYDGGSPKSAPPEASVDGTIDLTGEHGHAVKRKAANSTEPSESADSDSTNHCRRNSRRSTASKYYKKVKAAEIEEIHPMAPTGNLEVVQPTDTISEADSQTDFSIPRCHSPESMSTSSGRGKNNSHH
ncbi:uncharacterized protein FOMMEDRAFT_149862 [Fomitiporia mediterranea MF3/22]|uniref:uncharacterized protein n=1 Tax=Fomitiporia mediterranea (strain MF3/22) TaxID=694068 RepID=UPI0004409283|nr:uncharacterized protein FOMMEDRAFT_149862 [Fomitiporia mediterranea MF3/22]EJD07342.1 hypothetical protein FOMMEDRAFT_149862 [Fomitiporia mediterranea MF3/22]